MSRIHGGVLIQNKMSPEEQVFNIEALREKILEYVFADEDGDMDPDEFLSEIQSCRLVRKSWLYSVSTIFRKRQVPLFRLKLGQRCVMTSADDNYDITGDAMFLSQFVNAVTGESRMEEHVPPFKINATKNFFRKQNYQSFSDCMELCGQSLFELEVTFPKDGGSMTFVFPDFTLQNLQQFKVEFSHKELDYALREQSTFGNMNHATYLIQCILSRSKNLRTLNMNSNKFDNASIFVCQRLVPMGFEYLRLPQEITSLVISCTIENEDWQFLKRNSFTNLKYLELNIPCKLLEEGVIFEILEKACSTLESLVLLNNCQSMCQSNQSKLFRFPLMPKLTEFSTISSPCELEDNLLSLETYLPSLEELILNGQTPSMFQKWINGSLFESVTELCTFLIDETFDLERMENVNRTFPNLTNLNITFRGTDMSGLKYIFKEMRQLEELHLGFRDDEGIRDSQVLDSVFLGIPEHWVSALKTNQTLWNSEELKNDSFPSVNNLTELRELYLNGHRLRDTSLISDLVFQFGFFKMANLLKVSTDGPFLISPEVVREWMSLGRVIEIENTPIVQEIIF